MTDLIETIRTATTDGATTDQKRAAAAACRALLTSLEARPGETLGLPILPSHPMAPSPTAPSTPLALLGQLDVDQVLDLVIAKLSSRVPGGTPAAPSRYVPPPLALPGGAPR
ncbi:MAG: hypothetical protein KC464_10330 [Myxococcales bacterium]|nr:hypothetical protein [Myxococcales bacterium]